LSIADGCLSSKTGQMTMHSQPKASEIEAALDKVIRGFLGNSIIVGRRLQYLAKRYELHRSDS
jgi:hypothetical protein